MTYVHGTMLAGIAAVALTVPATAALVTSTPTRVVQPTVVQYAQDFKHGMRESSAYKSRRRSPQRRRRAPPGKHRRQIPTRQSNKKNRARALSSLVTTDGLGVEVCSPCSPCVGLGAGSRPIGSLRI